MKNFYFAHWIQTCIKDDSISAPRVSDRRQILRNANGDSSSGFTERKGHDAVFVLSEYKIKKKNLVWKYAVWYNSRCGNDPFITIRLWFLFGDPAQPPLVRPLAGYFVFFFVVVWFYSIGHRRRVYCDRESVVLQSKNAETFSPSRWERHETWLEYRFRTRSISAVDRVAAVDYLRHSDSAAIFSSSPNTLNGALHQMLFQTDAIRDMCEALFSISKQTQHTKRPISVAYRVSLLLLFRSDCIYPHPWRLGICIQQLIKCGTYPNVQFLEVGDPESEAIWILCLFDSSSQNCWNNRIEKKIKVSAAMVSVCV